MKKMLLLFGMLALSFLGFAQVSKQQAIKIVMDSVVGNDSTHVNVYMEPFLQQGNNYKLSKYNSINMPYSNCWLFFIDDMPEYGWGHNCRYVFVNNETRAVSITNSQTPPWHYRAKLDKVSEPVGFGLYQNNLPIFSDTGVVVQPVEGKYAVLFSGGEENDVGNPCFWNALSHSYCGLIENGFKKENIFVLSCNGNTVDSVGHPTNLFMDLNQDGTEDILRKECNVENLQSIFDTLARIMGDGDLLYVYGTMHGHQDEDISNRYWLSLWEQEPLYDTVFASMLSRVNCSQYIVNIWSCFSAGIVDDIVSISNEVRKTVLSCTGYRFVFRDSPFNDKIKIDSYNYFINTALRYYHPKSKQMQPWLRDTVIGALQDSVLFSLLHLPDVNFDMLDSSGNKNGIDEIYETIEYTSYFDGQFNQFGVKHYDCGFEDDLLSLHGITGKVIYTDTVSGSFHIEDTLSICVDTLTVQDYSKFYLFDADLMIEDTASLLMKDSTAIIARSGSCRVIVKGGISIGNGVTFESRDGSTLQVVFENDADLTVSNANFINCDLVLPEKNLSFTNCHFIGTPFSAEVFNFKIGNYAVNLTNCDFIPNGRTISDAIRIKRYSSYLVQGCSIDASGEGSFTYGISIFNSGSNTGTKCIRNNSVKGCLSTGVMLYTSYGDIRMNTIEDNRFGVKLFNNSNIDRLTGDCEATTGANTQYIHDNDRYEVFMTANCIPETFKYNYISDDDTVPFVYYDAYHVVDDPGISNRSNIDVTLNYWGNNFSPSTHLYSNPTSTGYLYQPYWVMGNCNSINNISAALLLSEADSLNNIGEYASARSVYMQVVGDYPNTISAETALKTLLLLEENAGNNYGALKAFYLANEAIVSDENLSHLALSLANKCDEKMENFNDAITWYENVLTNPNTSFNDSIFAAIDLGDLYLRMEAGGEKAIGKYRQYMPRSAFEYKKKTEYALSLLPRNTIAEHNNHIELSPIRDLEVSVGGNDTVLLNWDIPVGAKEALVSWSDMNEYSAYGTAAAQCATDQAAHFDADDLADFVGWKVKNVSVILSQYDGVQDPHYYVRIWKGEGNAPEQEYEKEIIYPEFSVPLTVSVDSIVSIEEGQELWIGYYIDKYQVYPWAVDDGPFLEKGFNFRLYHKHYPETDCLPDNLWHQGDSFLCGNLCISATLSSPDTLNMNKANNIPLTGYRIYRDGELIQEIPYSFVTYFTDTEFARGTDVEYCVTAVYGEEESESVCATATITGVGEAEADDGVTVSPNPSSGLVRIEGATVAEVQVYNAIGQLVKTVQNANEIDMGHLSEGVYLLRITATDGILYTRKVTLSK